MLEALAFFDARPLRCLLRGRGPCHHVPFRHHFHYCAPGPPAWAQRAPGIRRRFSRQTGTVTSARTDAFLLPAPMSQHFLDRAVAGQMLGENDTFLGVVEGDSAAMLSRVWYFFLWGLANSMAWLAAQAIMGWATAGRDALLTWLRPRMWRATATFAVRAAAAVGARLPIWLLAGSQRLRLHRVCFYAVEGGQPQGDGPGTDSWACRLHVRLPHGRTMSIVVGAFDTERGLEGGRSFRAIETACQGVFAEWDTWCSSHCGGVLDTSLFYVAGPPPQLQVGTRAPLSNLCRALLRTVSDVTPSTHHTFYGVEQWI